MIKIAKQAFGLIDWKSWGITKLVAHIVVFCVVFCVVFLATLFGLPIFLHFWQVFFTTLSNSRS